MSRNVAGVSRLFAFPDPVNEKAARTVAAGVAALSVAIIVLAPTAGHAYRWLLPVLVYGFLARVLTGPTLSPLGQLATRVVAPRLGEPKYVPGPPKRFAQGMGLALSSLALVFAAIGEDTAAIVVVALILVAAILESALAFCIGCRVFALLMRAGLVPESVCEACADIRLRRPVSQTS